MALTARRHRFGGTSADATQSVGEGNVAVFEPSVTLWAWNASTGGSRLTDLQDEGGDSITEVVSTAANPTGQVPPFYGPAGDTEVWIAAAEDTTGVRLLLAASDLAADISALDVIVDAIEVEASGIQSVNTFLPDGAGNLALAPDSLVPAAAVATDVTELQDRVYTTTVVQSGGGYAPRPSYADYVHWVGELDPAASAVDGDEWHYPDTAP